MNKRNPGSKTRTQSTLRELKAKRRERRKAKREEAIRSRLRPLITKINDLELEVKRKNLLIDTLKGKEDEQTETKHEVQGNVSDGEGVEGAS